MADTKGSTATKSTRACNKSTSDQKESDSAVSAKEAENGHRTMKNETTHSSLQVPGNGTEQPMQSA
ncbi:hypothetical protein PILCRDRAFT_14735 [Piloderma croceum F 1598]|uniref:Uncharacterized protein n=1 Tax=Piloderma croceum (strain F 1598) TaxID=765440 RepID=A0A0C3F1T2_PILCF|nr:hypothetical protein PILCRDRAFT_14735 [Piloderma croceum F 1598]